MDRRGKQQQEVQERREGNDRGRGCETVSDLEHRRRGREVCDARGNVLETWSGGGDHGHGHGRVDRVGADGTRRSTLRGMVLVGEGFGCSFGVVRHHGHGQGGRPKDYFI